MTGFFENLTVKKFAERITKNQVYHFPKYDVVVCRFGHCLLYISR